MTGARVIAVTRSLSAASFVAIFVTAGTAHAVRSGLDGYTGKNGPTCSACHKGGTTPTVTITGPQALTAGHVAEYKVRVQTSAAGVGMGGAATDGVTVTPSTNTKQKFAEVAHSSVLAPSNGAAEFTFKIQAPPTNGPITVYAIGNAVDNNRNASGDAARAAAFDVTVTGGQNPAPPEVDAGKVPPPDTNGLPGGLPPTARDAGPVGSPRATTADAGAPVKSVGNVAPSGGSSAMQFEDGSVECSIHSRAGAHAARGAGWFALLGATLVARRLRRRGTSR